MSLINRLRTAVRGMLAAFGGEPVEPPPIPEAGDGHAPGHRHLGPPPQTPTPTAVDTEPPTAQPWVRTTHSDSQKRRFRR
jgi:hypothetical protein